MLVGTSIRGEARVMSRCAGALWGFDVEGYKYSFRAIGWRRDMDQFAAAIVMCKARTRYLYQSVQ